MFFTANRRRLLIPNPDYLMRYSTQLTTENIRLIEDISSCEIWLIQTISTNGIQTFHD